MPASPAFRVSCPRLGRDGGSRSVEADQATAFASSASCARMTIDHNAVVSTAFVRQNREHDFGSLRTGRSGQGSTTTPTDAPTRISGARQRGRRRQHTQAPSPCRLPEDNIRRGTSFHTLKLVRRCREFPARVSTGEGAFKSGLSQRLLRHLLGRPRAVAALRGVIRLDLDDPSIKIHLGKQHAEEFTLAASSEREARQHVSSLLRHSDLAEM